jgi:hypothetical protein
MPLAGRYHGLSLAKRYRVRGRVLHVMSFVTAVDPDPLVRLSALLAHMASWKSVILLLGVLVIGLVSRLLAEWQRRKTLVAIVKHARGGSVIEQGRGHGGPAMRIEIGAIPNDQDTPGGGR